MHVFLMALPVVALSASCSKVETISGGETDYSLVNFTVSTGEVATKAVSAYTTSQSYETAANKVQILVFDSAGKLNAYIDAGTSLSGIQTKLSYGPKEVYAVVNGPSLTSVKTKSELQATTVNLSDNGKSSTKGFVMVGSGSVNLASATATVPITVSRLTARVALVSVTNSLPSAYGQISVDYAFLSNVVGNQNLAGNAAPTIWYNKEGRADETTRNTAHIINGGSYLASCPELTFTSFSSASVASSSSLDLSGSPALFYSYPNSSSTAPSGFHATFSAQQTELVVAVTISGQRCYYPIVIPALAANKAYTVALTVSGLGSDDPETPVEKGTVTANINVAGWGTGDVYDQII